MARPHCDRCHQPHPKCNGHNRAGGPCMRNPKKGTPVCLNHGGGAPQVQAAARLRVIEDTARAELAREGLVLPKDVDPFAVIEDNIRDAEALRQRLKRIVDGLRDDELRYAGRAGEQSRAELQFFVQLIERSTRAAATAIKLDLAERRVRIEERRVNALLEAIRATVQELGLTETAHPQLKAVLIKHLKAVGAEVA